MKEAVMGTDPQKKPKKKPPGMVSESELSARVFGIPKESRFLQNGSFVLDASVSIPDSLAGPFRERCRRGLYLTPQRGVSGAPRHGGPSRSDPTRSRQSARARVRPDSHYSRHAKGTSSRFDAILRIRDNVSFNRISRHR